MVHNPDITTKVHLRSLKNLMRGVEQPNRTNPSNRADPPNLIFLVSRLAAYMAAFSGCFTGCLLVVATLGLPSGCLWEPTIGLPSGQLRAAE